MLACHRCYDDRNQCMFTSVAVALRSLWEDSGVRRAVSRGYEYELNDSAI